MPAPDRVIDAVRRKMNGSVVAPAGYGKTETIADLVAIAGERCLLLTHTLAGVEALKKRLREKGVGAHQYQLDTIAAWSLRYASSYPNTAGFKRCLTPRGQQWEDVYLATATLLNSRTVDEVIRTSFELVLVDEYQDCSLSQHDIIKAISRIRPTLIFGDPLQGIFDFGEEKIVSWARDVSPAFPQIHELDTPWRWQNKGNHGLARWLADARRSLEAGRSLNLRSVPNCVKVHHVTHAGLEHILEARACNGVRPSDHNRLAIIGAKGSEDVRAGLAKRVRAQNVEAIDCKKLYSACERIEATAGEARLLVIMDLLRKSMVGVKTTPFMKRVLSIQAGKRLKNPPTPSESAALQVIRTDELEPLIALIDEFRKIGRTFRGELVFALRETLVASSNHKDMPLAECAWHVQERRRHAGRRHGSKIVTSTLLAKGLEFENTVVFLTPPMSKEDVYVAITRASLRIDIVTPTLDFQPA